MLHNCRYCDYQSPYKSNLRRHSKNKHEENINNLNDLAVPAPPPYAPLPAPAPSPQKNQWKMKN